MSKKKSDKTRNPPPPQKKKNQSFILIPLQNTAPTNHFQKPTIKINQITH
jgi:hypothetical protein